MIQEYIKFLKDWSAYSIGGKVRDHEMVSNYGV